MRTLLPSLFFVVVSVSTIAACSSSTSGGGGNAAAAKACRDTADAAARAAERCGGNYQQSYDSFVQQAAAGDCDKVIGIRDEASLRGTCIPSFMTITCAEFMAAMIDASCSKQLQRAASFTPTLGPASVFSEEIE